MERSVNFCPKYIRINNGNAAPNAYPITAPMPPHVAADAGPNNIHAPNADDTKLDVSEKVYSFDNHKIDACLYNKIINA